MWHSALPPKRQFYDSILFIKTQQGFAVAFIAAKPCFYIFFFGNTKGSCRYTNTRYSAMKHQMMGSHRMTALYWNFGMNTSTKITLPTSSITLENSGRTFWPRLYSA